MKSNKKRIFLVFAILTMALLLSFVFVACDKKKDEPAPPQNTSPSEGLEYSFDKYGSPYGYVVTDIGSCTDNNVIIPSEYKSRTVKSIGDNAFKDCIGITSITIPDSVTSIGYNAFSGCTKLENIYYTGDIASWCKISGLNNLLTSLRTLYINGNKIEGNLNIPNNVTSIGSYSFSFCGKLTGITIPDSVTSIDVSAFAGCSNLTNITIPDSVTSIGDSAFADCSNLANITIPNSVTCIGNDAFRDCTGLVNITIGDSVSNIGYSAFLNTAWYDNQPDGLVYAGKVAYRYKGTMPENTSISLKRDTISINNSAFVNCNGLERIMIPDSVTTIGAEAFYGCTSLSNIMIPDSVTNIGGYAFNGCSGLTSITGSATNVSAVARQARPTSFVVNITSGNIIDNYAFSECTGLTSIAIPDSVTSIGYSAFFGCKELTSVTIGKGITNIGDYAFYNCIGLKDVTFSDSVTSIGKSAFYGCSSLTTVTIGNSVTSIGNAAFSGCTGLTNITIPDSVTGIDDAAFYGCGNIENIYITDLTTWCNISGLSNLMSYGSNNKKLFLNGSLIKDLVLSDNVTTVPDYAFLGCTMLESITGSATSVSAVARQARPTSFVVNITSGNIIDNSAFSECSGLTSITIPDCVTSIGYSAFSNCNRLTTITIPDGVTSIGAYAFLDCTRLTIITIPDSVTSIGGSAFSNTAWYNNQPDGLVYVGKVVYKYKGKMPNNTSIILKEGTLGIAANAFSDCYGLTIATIPDSVTNIGSGAFSNCYKLTRITMGNGVKNLGGWAFQDCSSLTSITIPDSVTSIGDYTFSGCSGLTSIIIGSGVTNMGNYAFSNCGSLVNITFNGTIAQWNAIIKSETWKKYVSDTCTVVCTDGTIYI